MRILISGSNGMIGTAVAPYITQRGHEVIRLVRREAGSGEVRWDPDTGAIDAAGLEGFDGVIHLASLPWNGRWTSSFKQRIRANRLQSNRLLAETLANCKRKPQVFMFASGMGIYPSSGDQVITENSPTGSDFVAQLQCDGEAAAQPAHDAGIRVVSLRIPMVLGGETLQRVMGRMGDGRQWWSWIARDEMGPIVEHALTTDRLVGPVNPTSPNPVRNVEFAAILCKVLDRKPGLPMPAFVLRLLLDGMADALILASRRMQPRRLLDTGYQFRYPDLEGALRNEFAHTT